MKRIYLFIFFLAFSLFAVSYIFAQEQQMKGSSSLKVYSAADEKPVTRGAAQIWAQVCNRCHNAMPATTYSDAEWDVIMRHMRIRAQLTPEEEKSILDFLKRSN